MESDGRRDKPHIKGYFVMEFLRTMVMRLASLFRRRKLDSDLDAELKSHLEMAIELNLAQGMSAEEARREALLGFGGLEQTKQLYRERRGLPIFENALQDLRFSIRILRRSPGFSIVIILCLTLGIGANAAVSSGAWVRSDATKSSISARDMTICAR